MKMAIKVTELTTLLCYSKLKDNGNQTQQTHDGNVSWCYVVEFMVNITGNETEQTKVW